MQHEQGRYGQEAAEEILTKLARLAETGISPGEVPVFPFPACDLRLTKHNLPTMARKKNLILIEPIHDRLKTIKVRLDARTVITLGNLHALEFWKQRYPLAEVIG